ncbi:AMP-binding protein [Schlegelella sp. S2-27]|uniref:AMP-binding protein n=1 Tax=Caldimonas mangrovi TaxID=2944811 RepID=A0ABT0YVC7_9BURK|nr:AMP-binding protein [Caldimonas mangrovi]MCM5682695.1 AMP-binding protein [Caldimonas mangrovi]
MVGAPVYRREEFGTGGGGLNDWIPLTEVGSRAGHASRPVAWRTDGTLDGAAFSQAVARWQGAFSGRNGKRWALYLEDSFEFAAALYGAWHAGKTPFLLGDAQPATLSRVAGEVDGFAGDLPGGIGPDGAESDAARRPLERDEVTVVMYTSGSSGEPTAIEKRLAQLDAEVHTLEHAFGTLVADCRRVHATVSHQHIYGLLFLVLWPLAAGRSFSARRIDYPEQIAVEVGREPSLLISSPAHLKRLPATLDWNNTRGRLRAVFSSGGPLPAEAALHAAALWGRAPIEVFGSSETGGVAWRQRDVHGDAWQPLPGVEWRVDEGSLAVRSLHLPTDAWWQTSDQVEVQRDGTFVLLGRADRIVKIEEKRVSLTALERHLTTLPDVAEARVVLLPLGAGVRTGAVVVLTTEGRETLQRVGRGAFNARLRQSLGIAFERIALPRRWRYVDTLPVNAQGKTTQASLLALFDASRPEHLRWLARGTQEATAEIEVHAGQAVFDGHFPGAPILPGVVQLDWAVTLGQECFGLSASVRRIDALKFQRPILPGTVLKLVLQWHATKRQLQFHLESAAGLHASGRVLFAGEHV